MTEKPKTQRAMIEQLWFVVIGSNGDGLVAMVKKALEQMGKQHEDIEKIKGTIPALWTREQHEKMHEQYVAEHDEKEQKIENQGERRKISRREIINYIITGLLSLALIIVTVVKK